MTMVRRLGIAAVVALSLIGAYGVIGFARQLHTDYQNFRKIVVWVAQKQQQEEQARQRAMQQQQSLRAAPQPVPQPTATTGPER
jgi:hypothetical protein